MAITARCCLNLPPHPRDSNSNIIDKSPSSIPPASSLLPPICSRSREGDDGDDHQRILGPSPSSSWKRSRCVLVMTCTTMMVITTAGDLDSTTGNYHNYLAAAMANDSATATATSTARWSEKIRGCPSWNFKSTYETIVPENLPRPSKPGRGWGAINSGTRGDRSSSISESQDIAVAPSVAAGEVSNDCFSM